jgi:hypothetical protein
MTSIFAPQYGFIKPARATLSRSEAATMHGQGALMIFRGILDELTVASPHARPRCNRRCATPFSATCPFTHGIESGRRS